MAQQHDPGSSLTGSTRDLTLAVGNLYITATAMVVMLRELAAIAPAERIPDLARQLEVMREGLDGFRKAFDRILDENDAGR